MPSDAEWAGTQVEVEVEGNVLATYCCATQTGISALYMAIYNASFAAQTAYTNSVRQTRARAAQPRRCGCMHLAGV